MNKIIIKKFRETYKNSSLFNSWDGCENDLVKFLDNACRAAYNQGWKDKAEQTLRAMKDFVLKK